MQFNILFLTIKDLSILDFMAYSLKENLPEISINTFEAKYDDEATVVLNEEKIDLIIADMNIDTLESYEFYDQLQLHNQYKNIPFIFISANEEDQEIALLKGISNFFLKPLNINHLLDTLKNILKDTTIINSNDNLQFKILHNSAEEIEKLLENYNDNKEQIFQLTSYLKSQLKQLSTNSIQYHYS
jgi:response regulator RpfG family c-di-GMP phosphodiesterase